MLLSVPRCTDESSPPQGLRSLLVSDVGGGRVVTRTIAASPDHVARESGAASPDQVAADQEEGDDGFWVPYGRGKPRRRLPPPIPSLAARSTLRRTRTEDMRLVITRLPVVRREFHVRSRRHGGRLIMHLVESEDSDPLPAQEDGIAEATTSPAVEEDEVPVPAPQPLPSVGCFEDVVKYGYSIASSPLHQMPVLRMVH